MWWPSLLTLFPSISGKKESHTPIKRKMKGVSVEFSLITFGHFLNQKENTYIICTYLSACKYEQIFSVFHKNLPNFQYHDCFLKTLRGPSHSFLVNIQTGHNLINW